MTELFYSIAALRQYHIMLEEHSAETEGSPSIAESCPAVGNPVSEADATNAAEGADGAPTEQTGNRKRKLSAMERGILFEE